MKPGFSGEPNNRGSIHCPAVSFIPTISEAARRRQWHPPPVLLPGKSHGQKSLGSCSPQGHKESDTTERLHFYTLEKEMATHSSVLAWRTPGTVEPGGLPFMGSHRVRHNWSDLAAAAAEAALSSLRTFSKVTYQFLLEGSCGNVFKFSVGTS